MASTAGARSNGLWRVILVCTLLVIYVVLSACASAAAAGSPQDKNSSISPNLRTFSVSLRDETGSVLNPARAVVRISNSVTTDPLVGVVPCDPTQQLMAVWLEGFEVAIKPCDGQPAVMKPLQAADNPYHAWLSAVKDCNRCHARQIADGYDEMNEWLRSGHSEVDRSRYFETMYLGTSLRGKQSPPTRWTLNGTELVKPPPVMDGSYAGPGFKLDYPDQVGNCAYCHLPAAISASQNSVNPVDPSVLGGAAGEGITCDVCHKVFNVMLNDDGYPFVERPGVLSFQFLRPADRTFTIGPFSNFLTQSAQPPATHDLTCSPVFSRSEFCAPCHYGKFGDMVIYNSYGEWKESPFAANPESTTYRSCQDCHMSHMRVDDAGSLPSQRQACSQSNTSFRDFSHNLMDFGVYDASGQEIPRMVKNAAKVTVNFQYRPEQKNTLDVFVRVTNTRAGHKFPTDSPLRHLILVVRAEDRAKTSLPQVSGERLPNWAGPSGAMLDEKLVTDYRGQAGKIFANLLVEEDTNLWPSAAYWNETKHAIEDSLTGANSDNRLRPGVPDDSAYSFSIPDSGNIKITVELIYRYAFYDLMVQKEWEERPDIFVTGVECEGSPTQPVSLALACKPVQR